MIRITNISFLLFAVALFLVNTATATPVDSKHDVEYTSEGNPQSSSVFPENRPDLFAIHRQGRSVVNLIRTLPVPNAKNNDQEIDKPGLLSEIPIRRAVSIYLYYSRDLDQSLTIRELIFPFHHFL
jgi:hypothetical protein